jgi:hypothetical protein
MIPTTPNYSIELTQPAILIGVNSCARGGWLGQLILNVDLASYEKMRLLRTRK